MTKPRNRRGFGVGLIPKVMCAELTAATKTKRTPIGVLCFWVQGPDLNRRPPGYEPDELPSCSTPRYLFYKLCFGTGTKVWCRRPGSNRYGRKVPRDFKSRASASSATPAHAQTRLQPIYHTISFAQCQGFLKKSLCFSLPAQISLYNFMHFIL